MFLAANDKVQNQKLKIQQLLVRAADVQLYTNSGSDTLINIGEAVAQVVAVLHQVDATPAITPVAAASLSIQDHVMSSGDQSDIKIAGQQLAANDLFYVMYITKN